MNRQEMMDIINSLLPAFRTVLTVDTMDAALDAAYARIAALEPLEAAAVALELRSHLVVIGSSTAFSFEASLLDEVGIESPDPKQQGIPSRRKMRSIS